jgi:ketosteroid isomerase-like protein
MRARLCTRLPSRGLILRALAAGLLLCAAPAIAAELPVDLAAASRNYDRAQFENDVGALRRLVTDDFVLVNSDASLENKTQFLADFELPGFKIEPYVIDQPIQKVWENGALLGGIVHLNWTQDGKRASRGLRVVYVWIKRNGRWQAAYAQLTRLPQ